MPLAQLAENQWETVSHTAAIRDLRLAIVADSHESLDGLILKAEKRLEDPKCMRIQDAAGIYFTEQPLYQPGSVAFLFPGEGAQFAGMLSGLPQRFPFIEQRLKDCLQTEQRLGLAAGVLRDCLLATDNEGHPERDRQLQDFGLAIATVMSCSWCLYDILSRFGIRPDAIAGHSAGESSALFAAKAISADTPFSLIERMIGLRDVDSHSTSMLAVGAGTAKVQQLLSDSGLPTGDSSGVFLAMDNCPHQVVLVGAHDAIARADSILRRANLIVQQLDLPRPYHTKLFRPFASTLAQVFESMEFREPEVPIYSCATATRFPNEPAAIRELSVKQWERPVQFTQMIKRMHDDGIRILIEVGPRGNLTSFVEDILRGKSALAIAANRVGKSAESQIMHLVAQLAVHRVPFDWEAMFSGASSTPKRTASDVPQRNPPVHAIKLETESDKTNSRIRKAISRFPVMPAHSAGSPQSAAQQLLLRHQHVMHQFLETQRSVMQNYLLTRSTPTTAATPLSP